jgi:hypothetical protein
MTTGNHPEGIVERMHAELDGTNTPSQSQELKDYLAAHPEARREFAGLSALTRHIDAQPQAEPPAHLIHRILDAIPFGLYPREARVARTPHAGGLRLWLSTVFPRHRMRYATAFGLGVAAGCILLWSTVTNRSAQSPLDVTSLYGTIGAVETGDGFEELGGAGVDVGTVRGEIRLHESNHHLMADVSLDPANPIEWVLRCGSGVAFDGYRRVEGAASSVSASGNTMRVSQAEKVRFVLFFAESDAAAESMSIEIFESGKLIYQKEFGSVRG